jgi:hypothetical protein
MPAFTSRKVLVEIPPIDSCALVGFLPQLVDLQAKNVVEDKLANDATYRAGCIEYDNSYIRRTKQSASELERFFSSEDGLGEVRLNGQ